MKVFGRYLNYRLKQSFMRTVVFSVLSIMVSLSMVEEEAVRAPEYIKYCESGIYILATILGIFSTLIPILELSGFKNRRNLDTLYFFPIKRSKMALVHYLSGVIQVFVIYTLSFLSVWIFLLTNTDYFALEWMPLYYLFSLILGLVMYSVFTFIFNEANTVADGALFCGLWMFAVYVVLYTVIRYFVGPTVFPGSEGLDPRYRQLTSLVNWGIIYTPINDLTVIFQELIEINQNPDYVYVGELTHGLQYFNQMYMFFVWLAVGIAAAVGYFVRFTRKGAHMAGEPSTSPWGFKLLIPLYGYSLLFTPNLNEIFAIIIFALMLIGYFIYRRGFKLKKSDIIFIACGIIPMILVEALN